MRVTPRSSNSSSYRKRLENVFATTGHFDTKPARDSNKIPEQRTELLNRRTRREQRWEKSSVYSVPSCSKKPSILVHNDDWMPFERGHRRIRGILFRRRLQGDFPSPPPASAGRGKGTGAPSGEPPLPGPLLHKSVEAREKYKLHKNRDAPHEARLLTERTVWLQFRIPCPRPLSLCL